MAGRDIAQALIFSVKWMSAFSHSICFFSSKVFKNCISLLSSLNTYLQVFLSLSFHSIVCIIIIIIFHSVWSQWIFDQLELLSFSSFEYTHIEHPFEVYWKERDVERNKAVQAREKSFVAHHWNLIDFEWLHNEIDDDDMNDEYEELEQE